MNKITSLILISLLTACSVSHTDRIKQQLGNKFNETSYINAGGESKSKERYELFCSVIKENSYAKEVLQYKAVNSIHNQDDLRLINAEIQLANKDCK